MKLRSALYKSARILGHAEAIRKGKATKRAARVTAGKVTARLLGRLFR